MKVGFVLFAALMINGAAIAETMGTWTQEQNNSDILTVEFTDTVSTLPACHGELEALAHTSSLGEDFRLARGCWKTDQSYHFVAVDLYAYSDGREMNFPVQSADIKPRGDTSRMLSFLTPSQQEIDANAADKQAAAKMGKETGKIITNTPRYDLSFANMVQVVNEVKIAGECRALEDITILAKTKDQTDLITKLRASIAVENSISEPKLNDACALAKKWKANIFLSE
jgi:hypothetical protein